MFDRSETFLLLRSRAKRTASVPELIMKGNTALVPSMSALQLQFSSGQRDKEEKTHHILHVDLTLDTKQTCSEVQNMK